MLRGALNRVSEAGSTWRIYARMVARAAIKGLNRRIPTVARIAAWALVAISLGFVIGLAAVVLPPTGAFGIVALAGLVLLWALPELPAVPVRAVQLLFVTVLLVDLCVPGYYGVQLVGLPWITVRRLFTFPLIIVFAISISGSAQVRRQVVRTIESARFVSFCIIGFYISILLSIFTSASPAGSLSGTAEASLTWYVPWLALLFIVGNEADLMKLLRLIGWCAIFVSLGGVLEFVLQHRYFVDIIPKPIFSGMMENSPTFAAMVNTSPYRNGLYRASSIFANSLSFGEFEAIVAPFGYTFLLHEETTRGRAFGLTIVLSSLVGIFVSGARGAYVALLVSTAAFAALWLIRTSKFDRHRSLAPSIAVVLVSTGLVATILLIMFWGRTHNMVVGGGADQRSTEARYIQWAMALPKIIQNPITGNGFDMGAGVVGFYNPGTEFPTLDSYVISLLVETGVPSLLFFFGAIAAGIWIGVREYLSDSTIKGGLAGGLACALVAFVVYRLVLSQKESHTLLYLFMGALIALARVKRDQSASAKEATRFAPVAAATGGQLRSSGNRV